MTRMEAAVAILRIMLSRREKRPLLFCNADYDDEDYIDGGRGR